MTDPLTPTQLSTLQAILDDTDLTTDQRVQSYYTALASHLSQRSPA